MARDFRDFRPATPEGGPLETGCGIAKPAIGGLFCDGLWPNRDQRDCLAGAGGFEPPHGGIKIPCLTTWRRPKRPVGKTARRQSCRVLRATPVYRESRTISTGQNR